MTDYTYEMFYKDHDEMLPIIKVLKGVEIPEEEWLEVAPTSKEMQEQLGLSSDHIRRVISQLEKKGLLTEVANSEGRYRLNPNNPIPDTIGFFKRKYGRDKGIDYSIRFLNVMWFINDNREALKKKELIEDKGSGPLLVDEEMVQVMLESYCVPEPPHIFPISPLCDRYGIFSLVRVLKALRRGG